MKKLRNRRIYMVSLGCAKNRVDSEKTLAMLRGQGCEVVDDPEDADCFLVNTCGFVNEARQETIDTILELAEYKKKKRGVKLAVMGCMVQRFGKEMAEELPEIDHLVSLQDAEFSPVYDSVNTERVVQPGSFWAYLKISEGCGNSCTFCSIPMIRGQLKSRPESDILAEVRRLIEDGTREICLVAQDTTRYGADLRVKGGLVKLLKRIVELDPAWVRVMYAYPTLVSDELLELISGEPRIAPYMDIPFQHIDDGILRAMGRQETSSGIFRLVEKIRKAMPEGAIRSSFIVGFPGETEESFGRLKDFIREARLDHVGVFTYSPEEGTRAALLKDDVPEELKEERKGILMAIQKEVSLSLNMEKVGRTFEAMVERFDPAEGLMLGRIKTQAPEVDGELILDKCDANPGDIINVKITRAMEYDLVGVPA